MPTSPIHQRSFALRFIVVVAALGILNALLFPWELTLEWMREGGLVENANIFAYYLALASLWLFAPRALGRPANAAVSLLLIAAAARELDLHKAAFGMSILKSKFYLDYASGAQIAGALAILLPIFAAGAYLLMRHGRALLAAARAGSPAAVTVVTAIVFLVLLKLFDSLIGFVGGLLSKPGEIWGYTTPAGLITMTLEETLELTLPLLVVIAVIQARATQSDR